jgi:hypothetical protein
MQQEKEMSSQESLELITRMITRTRTDYYNSGVSALLWGSVITFCSLVTYANFYLQWNGLGYIWFLTIAAVVPQIIIAIREKKRSRVKTHEEDLMGGIWISFGIAVFLLSYILNVYPYSQAIPVFIVLYGVPTFATGYSRQFRPMVFGGLACWALAVLSLFCPTPYTLLCMAAAAQLAWFIPGLILRKCYLKAQKRNV